MKLIIQGQLPGANEYIDACRRNPKLANRMKRAAETIISAEIYKQAPQKNFTGPVFIRYTWVEPNRKRDKDNIAFAKKFIQDALVKAGTLKNDGWAKIEGFSDSFAVDKKRPRVEVEIKLCEN